MSRISISAGQKPKPKESFKFLRRDEGRLSYATSVAESPSKAGCGTPRVNNERRDSRSLREAIAHDMKNAKSSDPFGEVVIAVPKKAPPPAQGARGPESSQPTPASKRAPLPPPQNKGKPAWVDTPVPARQEPEAPPVRREPRQSPQADYGGAYQAEPEQGRNSRAPPAAAEYEAYAPPVDPRRGGGGCGGAPPAAADDGYDRYDAVTPGLARRPSAAPRRYTDPEFDGYERNFFRRPPPPGARDYDLPAGGGRGRGEEEELMLQLEQEVRAAQEERARYGHAKQQLDLEKKRFDAFRYTAQQHLDDERAELDAVRVHEQRATQKDVKTIEERYRNVSQLLSTEREANRKLGQENDSLRAQLEELTAAMREQQKVQRAEATRLRRDVESLTARNADLLAMAKDQQIHSLETAAGGGPATGRHPSSSAAVASRSPARGLSSSAPREASRMSNYRQAAPQTLASAEESITESGSNGAEACDPAVMDFTPRAKNSAAKERRAREIEEHLRREEEEMQRRRQQRTREAEERRARDGEEEADRTKQRAAAEAAAAVKRAAAEEKPIVKRRTTESLPPEEATKARKAAGHPSKTPRGAGGSGTPAAKKKVAAVAPVTSRAASKDQQQIPTREELLGGHEAMPEENAEDDAVVSETAIGDNPNKRERMYKSGKREILYANGTRKVVLPSGHTVLHFTNGDVKSTYPSGKSTYWYDAAETMHTQNPDSVQVFEFHATGQTERHLPDGVKEILYPDGIFKVVNTDGTDETFFPDSE